MRSHRVGLAVVTALSAGVLLAGCSSGGSKGAAGGGTSSAKGGSIAQCSSLLGKPASAWVKIVNGSGCLEGNTLTSPWSFDCKGGSQLLAFGNSPFYWGLTTSALSSQAGSPDTSVGQYGAAWKSCVS